MLYEENLRKRIILVHLPTPPLSQGFAKPKTGLTFICVKLEHRLQGIGSDLFQLAIEKAKAEGIPLAVTSEPASYEFFKKLGFKEGKHCEIDLSEHAPPYSGFGVFRLTGMLWSPEK